MWRCKDKPYFDNASLIDSVSFQVSCRFPDLLTLVKVKSKSKFLHITSRGGYVNFEILKITTHTVFHQRFELGTLRSESQCSPTNLNRDLNVKDSSNEFSSKGRLNESVQRFTLGN